MSHGYSNVKVETFFELDNNDRTRGHAWKLKRIVSTKLCADICSLKELLIYGTVWIMKLLWLPRSTSLSGTWTDFEDQERWVYYWTDVSWP